VRILSLTTWLCECSVLAAVSVHHWMSLGYVGRQGMVVDQGLGGERSLLW